MIIFCLFKLKVGGTSRINKIEPHIHSFSYTANVIIALHKSVIYVCTAIKSRHKSRYCLTEAIFMCALRCYTFLIKTDSKAKMSPLNAHSVAPRGWVGDS